MLIVTKERAIMSKVKSTKKSSKKAKVVVTGAMVIILVVASVVALYSFYNWSYKRGYQEGTNNQVLCQAATKDATLTKLCK